MQDASSSIPPTRTASGGRAILQPISATSSCSKNRTRIFDRRGRTLKGVRPQIFLGTVRGMLPKDRIAYSPIVDRPRLVLPGGARMAVWIIVNVEEWNAKEAMPRTVLTPPAGGSPMPDIPNWAWHEYGNRVGF